MFRSRSGSLFGVLLAQRIASFRPWERMGNYTNVNKFVIFARGNWWKPMQTSTPSIRSLLCLQEMYTHMPPTGSFYNQSPSGPRKYPIKRDPIATSKTKPPPPPPPPAKSPQITTTRFSRFSLFSMVIGSFSASESQCEFVCVDVRRWAICFRYFKAARSQMQSRVSFFARSSCSVRFLSSS